ncbi:molybdopterin-dependent oxidoreductase [Methylobrevis pamukkalensis]|uniref:Oxidoreductase molybdopterin binding domain protein n=1 Tax=Methylobrevis pamukkalensis TaxID=1439726 RepID=A0A1E3GVW3_9HYPH|nr:molybdopterin-dependent oxidoreductase [Methylobrevis pamukkalensis]ODN67686.1 Oxidoreductase molybdopterin binding domain protein [Methylobrevis pamukkalensis]
MTRRSFLATLATLSGLVLLPVLPALAGPLAAPTGEVVLTVSGKIAHTNVDGTAQFDLAMLEALAGRKATMETPWTEGSVTFEGPLGRAILETVGAEGSTLSVIALNDYAAEVPVEDFTDHDTILATRLNGAHMSVREKGPLFLIYPFDQDPGLYNEKYFSRSVWQIRAIEVK